MYEGKCFPGFRCSVAWRKNIGEENGASNFSPLSRCMSLIDPPLGRRRKEDRPAELDRAPLPPPRTNAVPSRSPSPPSPPPEKCLLIPFCRDRRVDRANSEIAPRTDDAGMRLSVMIGLSLNLSPDFEAPKGSSIMIYTTV